MVSTETVFQAQEKVCGKALRLEALPLVKNMKEGKRVWDLVSNGEELRDKDGVHLGNRSYKSPSIVK